ncbi:group I intron endonuclease [Actimicrobium sp. GrIS 1.19]|uniref:GIY-YIG nuclease family protein n=1 Tax=Actimicrobium sp. GrIS 1.19 TaxID=3071708 RepID=UPI002E0086F1|nr:group I intron endonuclease [Actimicrobium sp. GrIS 1.19]
MKISVDRYVIAGRVSKGYTAEDALRGNLKGRTRIGKSIEFMGQAYPSRVQLASQFGQKWSNVQRRLDRGWTIEQALLIELPPPRFRDFEGHARDHKWKEVRTADGSVEPVPDSHGYKLYLITNTINTKVYVGITIGSLENRLKQHFAAARRGRKSAFTNAITKYGEQAFNIEPISITALSYAELQALEVLEIAKRDSIRNGYNTAHGGSIGTSKAINIAGKTYQSYAGAAEAHGVDSMVFSLRVSRLKWTPEEAAGITEKQWTGKSIPVIAEGKTFSSIGEAAKFYGQKPATAHSRYRVKGWTIEQSLGITSAPHQTHSSSKSISILGVEYESISHAATILEVDTHALRRYLRLGLTPDDAYSKIKSRAG